MSPIFAPDQSHHLSTSTNIPMDEVLDLSTSSHSRDIKLSENIKTEPSIHIYPLQLAEDLPTMETSASGIVSSSVLSPSSQQSSSESTDSFIMCKSSSRECNNNIQSEDDDNRNIKTSMLTARPFKTYPRFPALSLNHDSQRVFGDDFKNYRAEYLSRIPPPKTCNKNMRRTTIKDVQIKLHEDPNYLEKRRKNNEAAKRSRDNRRAKEDDMAIRLNYLEHERAKHLIIIEQMNHEIERLRNIEQILKSKLLELEYKMVE